MTKKLPKSISDKNINATIRGSLSASNVLKQLKRKLSQKYQEPPTSMVRGHEFLISSVGIDEGNTLEEKA